RRPGDEDEETVAGLDLCAAARRQGAAPAVDHGDQGIAGKAELPDRGTRDGVVRPDREFDEIELARSRNLERRLRCRWSGLDEPEPSRNVLERGALDDSRDEHDEEHHVEHRVLVWDV